MEGIDQRSGVEDVVAHRRQHLSGAVGKTHRIGRLLQELADLPGLSSLHVDHAELVGEADRLADRRHRARRAGLDVGGHHLREVHPVDVVCADHHDDVGLLVPNQVQGLEDGVAAAEIPVFANALLGRHRRDVVAEHRRHPPRLGDVLVQAVGLVLREHDDLEVAGVDHVGQGVVDQPVVTSERHRRLRAIPGQRHQTLALAPGHDDRQHLVSSGCPAAAGGHTGECSGHRLPRAGSRA